MLKPDTPSNDLFSLPEHQRSRTSDVILYLIERTQDKGVTLRTLTERLGDRTFGILLLLMAVLNLIPFISMLTGLLVSVLGLQMLVGMTSAKLPQFILDKPLPAKQVRAALLVFLPKIRAMEKFVRPRWHFTEAPIVDRINGSVLVVIGIIILLPIPFANLVPAFVVFIMGLGLLERDGLLQICSAILGLIAFVLFAVFVLF